MNTLTLATACAEVRVVTSGAEVLVSFAGELDLSLAGRFASVPALVEARGLPVTVDLNEVTFFGAWAAAALLALRSAAPAGAFTVRGASETVRATLDACGLSFEAPAHAQPA